MIGGLAASHRGCCVQWFEGVDFHRVCVAVLSRGVRREFFRWRPVAQTASPEIAAEQRCRLQISSFGLFLLDRFKERLEVILAKALAALSLNNFKKEGGAVRQRLGKEL